MAKIDAIHAPRAMHGTLAHGEDHPVTLPQRHHHGPRLHARTLFSEDKFTAGEVMLGFREEERHLEGKHVLAVQILVETIVIATAVAKQQWRWSTLACLVAAGDELRVRIGIAHGNAHPCVPAIRQRREACVQGATQSRDEWRQRVAEIPVLALAETMPCHNDNAAESLVVVIQPGDGATLIGIEHLLDGRPTLALEM